MFERNICTQAAFAVGCGQIDTAEVGYLFVIVADVSVYVVVFLVAGQIYATKFPIAEWVAFIFEFIDFQVTAHHHVGAGFDIVRFCSNPSFHIRHIRQDTAELFQVDSGELDCHVLTGNGIFAIGIEAEARTCIVVQMEIGMDASAVCQEDIIIPVDRERTVNQCRMFGEKT